MQFNLHPQRYRVRVCPDVLACEGVEVDALTHGREILLSGRLPPVDRLEPLLDQLRYLRERHHGKLTADGLPGFIADVLAQLESQGGRPALMRLAADGLVDAGGMESLGAEPVGCECGRCGTRYGPHQIKTSGADFDAGLGKLVVERSVDCDFCGHVMSWKEGATPAGTPNGRVTAGPFYSRPHSTSHALE